MDGRRFKSGCLPVAWGPGRRFSFRVPWLADPPNSTMSNRAIAERPPRLTSGSPEFIAVVPRLPWRANERTTSCAPAQHEAGRLYTTGPSPGGRPMRPVFRAYQSRVVAIRSYHAGRCGHPADDLFAPRQPVFVRATLRFTRHRRLSLTPVIARGRPSGFRNSGHRIGIGLESRRCL